MRKEESVGRGQTIRTETGPDRSSHKLDPNEALNGRKMAGGPTDLSRTMKVGMYDDAAPKSRRSG